MITQFIHLPRWRWDIVVFYGSRPEDSDIIIDTLVQSGCSGHNLKSAIDNLESGIRNSGLTFTNPKTHESVMVIGETTSPKEFWNTLEHEKGHLTEHVARELRLRRYGEDYQYLAGDISGRMYEVAHMFLCNCAN